MHGLETMHKLNDDAAIKAFRDEADEHGDTRMVSLCNRALDGDELARRRVMLLIDDVEAERAASEEPVLEVPDAFAALWN